MTRFSWVTVIVAVIFVLLIVGSYVNWREGQQDQANPTPSPTGTLPLTVIPLATVTPEKLTRVPTAVTPDGVLWRATETPTPLVTATPVPTVTPSPTPSPSAAIQKGLAP